MAFYEVENLKLQRENIVTWLAVLVIAISVPSAIVDTIESGRIYLFSWQFIEELPQRFTGTGRLRFLLQPTVAIILGIRGGLADFRAGNPPYLMALIRGAGGRIELLRHGFAVIRNLIALGIIMDVIFQFVLYRSVHPVPALLIGPILICLPYTISRALTNRAARLAAAS